MADRVIRLATPQDDLAAAGVLTAEAFRADGLLDDAYLDELRDAARRAREARLLVALVPADGVLRGVPVPTDEAAGGTHAPTDEAAGGIPVRVDGSPRGAGSEPPSIGMALAGTVTVAPAGSSYANIAAPGEVEVRMLAVAPHARRRGIAEALTRAAMLDAAGLGAERVVLSTTDAMTTAQRLYGRLGFVARPDRDWQYGSLALRVYTWDVPRGPGARVESAVWHPREVRDVGGWRVGLSGGFTRRANSVLALAEPADVTASLDEVERIYSGLGQPSIFRVCAQSRPDDLDDLLEARGYRDVAHTVVMVRETLDGLPVVELARPGDPLVAGGGGLSYVVTQEPDERWLSTWLATKAPHPVDHELAAGVLSGGRAVYVRAAAKDEGKGKGEGEGETVGVIRAALEQEWVGLSCLVVHPGARRRGVGQALTIRALRLAKARGAERAFLQVVDSNDAAIALYSRLGFAPAERYHYRQR